MWKTFAYHITNYAMLVLPSRTSGDKILYTRSYKDQIGGDNSRTCKMRICNIRELRTLYIFACKNTLPLFLYNFNLTAHFSKTRRDKIIAVCL